MLIISFDAVGSNELEHLMKYPAFSAFSKQAAVFHNVPSLHVSNTYPIHTSVATGVVPGIHGLISNTEPFPVPHPVWNSSEAGIKVKTIWQAAAEHGIDTAAVLWPVTAFSKTIRYHIPEILARPGKSQILTSLRAGSKWLQLKMFLRHGKRLDGTKQPALDSFSTACMTDILREYKPGLAMIHLTAYDTLCHLYGKGSPELKIAYESLDHHLALLLEAAGEQEDVILFSDHSQINVHTVLDPNAALVSAGYLRRDKNSGQYLPGESQCFIECCGGSAFFHPGSLSPCHIGKVRQMIEQSEGFRRFLHPEELLTGGQGKVAFGFCAKAGYDYSASCAPKEKANHGYPLDMPDYTVFYMVRGDCPPGNFTGEGSLLDIAPLAARHLGFAFPPKETVTLSNKRIKSQNRRKQI